MERKEYIDYLRAFATFAVIVLHVAAENWYTTSVYSLEWQTFNLYDSIVRWGVPIFTMISGALFLKRDIPLKTIYLKYVLRIFIAFVFWSLIYIILMAMTIDSNGVSFQFVSPLITFLKGHYHMWYLLMISGLYICIPIFKKIVEDKNIMKYFLILSFVFTFVIPWLFDLVNDFISNYAILNIVSALNYNIGVMNLNLVLGFSFYFVLGYYISTIEIKKDARKIIYILSVLGFLLTILLDSYIAIRTNAPSGKYYGNFSINVLFEVLGIFVWFRYHKFDNQKLNRIMAKLSIYSFGVYLVHVLILEKINILFNVNTLSFFAPISVLAISILIGLISLIISVILNHIPVIKKYCV